MKQIRNLRGRNCMVAGFLATYAISVMTTNLGEVYSIEKTDRQYITEVALNTQH